MVLGDAVSTLEIDVCMDFEPCFKGYNLIFAHPKSMKLGKMANLKMIFHVVVSLYRSAKI